MTAKKNVSFLRTHAHFTLLFWLAGYSIYAQSGNFGNLIESQQQSGSFPLVTQDHVAGLFYDSNEYPGVVRAINDLQNDIFSVTAEKPEVFADGLFSKMPVIIGSIEKSAAIASLLKNNSIPSQDLEGKWESFVITTVINPFPNVEKALVIAGSDKRGTIYGIYELSRQLGVSPWYYWADVPAKRRSQAFISDGYFYSGSPKVKYRGIFINDENPAMQNWANAKFGGMNSKMYVHLFELMLRLRANYLWPAMWGNFQEDKPLVPQMKDNDGNWLGNSFNQDDPLNPKLADDYGIVMGTSHHEPMQRSQQEWLRSKEHYGNGQWNYVTNRAGIRQFFKEGIHNTKNYESLITLGMRGDDDKPMEDAGGFDANFRILEKIISDQRSIIKDVMGKSAAELPQVWTLYKEVLKYYDSGLKVPDDVIILLCDDNWGDVTRLPGLDPYSRHPGGYGMYYHVGYYGAPRASKWLNNNQISHIWEQMQFAYRFGVNKIWMLNVGDFKPNEYPTDFFLKMAWDPEQFNAGNLDQYAYDFCVEQYGVGHASAAAEILTAYTTYAARVVPEMLDSDTFNLDSGEFKQVRDEFLALEARALRLNYQMPEEYHTAFNHLIMYPVQALANLYDMYYSLAMNKKLAAEKDPGANYWADKVIEAFDRDAQLTKQFDDMKKGKWLHIIDQVHIGYTTWHAPHRNTMPEVIRVTDEEAQTGGVFFSRKK
jgi:Glycosyl hydrolase family 115